MLYFRATTYSILDFLLLRHDDDEDERENFADGDNNEDDDEDKEYSLACIKEGGDMQLLGALQLVAQASLYQLSFAFYPW